MLISSDAKALRTCGYLEIGHRGIFTLQKSGNAKKQDFFSLEE